MIKPCTGFTPEAGAEIFYKAAIGGVEITPIESIKRGDVVIHVRL